jgi:6-phosphogluconolactonase
VTDVDIVVVEDPARVVADRLVDAARSGGHLALTGGGTPRRAYEIAAELHPDWHATTLWWGDERVVPPDDERSNYRMAREALLDRLADPLPAVHRMRGELGKEAGAAEYEAELGDRQLDLVLLGMGPDGHIASLFPGKAALDERDRRVVGADAGLEPWVDRITLTLPALRDAGEVLFLITGESKAEAVQRAFDGPPDPTTPASLVRSARGRTWAVLDAAAAALLSR